jgi:hypothetical protein
MFHVGLVLSLPLLWYAKILFLAETRAGEELPPRLFSAIPFLTVIFGDWLLSSVPPDWCRRFYNTQGKGARVITFCVITLVQVVALGASELFSIPNFRFHWA